MLNTIKNRKAPIFHRTLRTPAHAEAKTAVEQMTRAMLASAMALRSSFDEIKGYDKKGVGCIQLSSE